MFSRFNLRKTKALLAAGIAVLALSSCLERSAGPAPVTMLGTRLDSPTGAVMVQKDDTLWSLSQRYRLPLRDIIDINGLAPPYALSAGQRIRLPAPTEHRVGHHDTLTRLARMYQVSVGHLVKANNLQSPYRISVGQVIRIPASKAAQVARRDDAIEAERAVTSALSDRIEAETLPPPRMESVRAEPLSAPVQRQPMMQQPVSPPQPATVMAQPKPVMTTLAPSARPDFVWPLRGKVVSGYGAKDGGLYNDGINIAAPRGTPVAAAAEGTVVYVGDQLGSYGNLVLIRHGGGMVTAYAHMGSVNVAKGMRVRKGQPIGTVGSSGTVSSAQLHFEIRKGSQTLDPKKFLG